MTNAMPEEGFLTTERLVKRFGAAMGVGAAKALATPATVQLR